MEGVKDYYNYIIKLLNLVLNENDELINIYLSKYNKKIIININYEHTLINKKKTSLSTTHWSY